MILKKKRKEENPFGKPQTPFCLALAISVSSGRLRKKCAVPPVLDLHFAGGWTPVWICVHPWVYLCVCICVCLGVFLTPPSVSPPPKWQLSTRRRWSILFSKKEACKDPTAKSESKLCLSLLLHPDLLTKRWPWFMDNGFKLTVWYCVGNALWKSQIVQLRSGTVIKNMGVYKCLTSNCGLLPLSRYDQTYYFLVHNVIRPLRKLLSDLQIP